MWFQRYDFLKDPPLHFMGEALGILYNLFGPGTFIYQMNAAYFLYVMPDMSLPPQNDQLSASWHDYLDTSY